MGVRQLVADDDLVGLTGTNSHLADKERPDNASAR